MKKLITNDVVSIQRFSPEIKDGEIYAIRKKDVKFEFEIFNNQNSYEVILRQPKNHKSVGIMNVIEELATQVYKKHLHPTKPKHITWFQDSPYDEAPRKVTMKWRENVFCEPKWQ